MGQGWLSRFIDGPADTPPPPSKREIQDHVAAGKGSGRSRDEIIKAVKSNHRKVIDTYTRGGDYVVVVPSDHPSFQKHVTYDSKGRHVSTEEKGISRF